jgi:hypothetical protein
LERVDKINRLIVIFNSLIFFSRNGNEEFED